MKKGLVIIAGSFLLLLISICIFIKFTYFYKKLPTKQIKLEEIKSVQVINLDRSKDRRNNYEMMLKQNIGDKFFGFKVGDEIRLSGIDGKKEVVFENIDNKKKITYDENKRKDVILNDGIYKVYPVNNNNLYFYYTNTEKVKFDDNSLWFNKFGCALSHLFATEKISKQQDNTYGLILEDDFLVDKDFYKKFEIVLNQVPYDFDIIKLSLQHRRAMAGYKKIAIRPNTLQVILKSFKKYGYGKWSNNASMGKKVKQFVNGAQAYIVSKKGAEKIMEYYKNNLVKHPNDVEYFYILPKKNNNIKVYTYLEDMPILLRDDAKESFIDLE